ncbi:uncharacterized protein LOC117185902 isoform X1 [Drosophila miranda]|uniref:uncharacterized protein LOC117185902 isoform X1 n=1 Tax=Drosophila miranda TaxID=7229 RepID=UPI00143F5302|nr:uncharacterized protein LOC117185902 isoform X1 [Drosophila miranda]
MLNHLIFALFMGCLICIIRAAPTLPPSTVRVHLKPSSSSIHSPRTTTSKGLAIFKVNSTTHDWWRFRSKTVDSNSKAKVQGIGNEKRLVLLDLRPTTNSQNFSTPSGRKSDINIERENEDKGLSKKRSHVRVVVPLSSTRLSVGAKDPKTRKIGVTPNTSMFPATRNQGLLLLDPRPATNAQNLSASSIQKSHIKGEGRAKTKNRSQIRRTTSLTSIHPSVGVDDPKTREIGVTSNASTFPVTRNLGLMLLDPRPITKAQNLSASSIQKSHIKGEGRTQTKNRSQIRRTTSLTSIHPSVGVDDPKTREIGVTSNASTFPVTRNLGLMLLDPRPITYFQNLSSPPSGFKSQVQKTTREIPMELTIPMKYLARPQSVLMMDRVLEDDQMIHTEAPVWKDTRYHFQHQSRQPKIRLESSPIMEFYPDDGKINTVCWDKSTIRRADMVMNYIKPHIYKKPYGKRHLYPAFRKANGTSGMPLLFCHSSNSVPVQMFLKCMIMRNMMMESLVPKYPYHQVQPGP